MCEGQVCSTGFRTYLSLVVVVQVIPLVQVVDVYGSMWGLDAGCEALVILVGPLEHLLNGEHCPRIARNDWKVHRLELHAAYRATQVTKSPQLLVVG